MASTFTEIWNDLTYEWDTDTGTDESEVSLIGGEFSIPNTDQETVTLTKVVFGNPDTFVNGWAVTGGGKRHDDTERRRDLRIHRGSRY